MNTFYPTIPFVKVNPDAPTPMYAREGDAGMDLSSIEEVEIAPQGTVKVGTGIAVAIPEGFEGTIRPRSGMATEKGVTLACAPSTVDSNYRGEIFLPLYNLGHETVVVHKGDRVAQLLIKVQPIVSMEEVDELPPSNRGNKGFGSSGYGPISGGPRP